MPQNYSFFDLANSLSGVAMPPAPGGFGGGSVTQNLFQNELGRQLQFGGLDRGFQDSMDRLANQQQKVLSGYQGAATLTDPGKVQEQFDIYGQSAQANLASQGLFGSSLQGVVAADAAQREKIILDNIAYQKSLASSEQSAEQAQTERLRQLEQQLRDALSTAPPPPTAPPPTAPPPTAPPSGPQHGDSRYMGELYGSPLFEYYDATTGTWTREPQRGTPRPTR